ncbi:hypothetical protein HXX25_08010 [Hyphobacterium sp. CCMP332]|jgi:hypothetical protein|uniref:hypothetical protein n=1 Tax=Hyphobacterium sp. CCMP332 TaxID=2749086 RepID=UPI0016502BBA|nr:hypothetical protein [Hyphobacterium sp. CCMP332]QNL19259.1 hypothetical protein HXX25_08010 [Hyphobacterium sp. CCMP332]
MRLFVPLIAIALVGCNTVDRVFSEAPDNPGPCPSALALYDAHRVVELTQLPATIDSVGFTGEINGVRSLCRYFNLEPINANLEIDFGFGRGPAAQGSTHTYTYFVAVTRRDSVVIHREEFPITVRFEPGQDRVFLTETISRISIPRATETTSGTNFEIIVGFDLTPEQIAWNRAGQRFRVDAGQDQD